MKHSSTRWISFGVLLLVFGVAFWLNLPEPRQQPVQEKEPSLPLEPWKPKEESAQHQTHRRPAEDEKPTIAEPSQEPLWIIDVVSAAEEPLSGAAVFVSKRSDDMLSGAAERHTTNDIGRVTFRAPAIEEDTVRSPGCLLAAAEGHVPQLLAPAKQEWVADGSEDEATQGVAARRLELRLKHPGRVRVHVRDIRGVDLEGVRVSALRYWGREVDHSASGECAPALRELFAPSATSDERGIVTLSVPRTVPLRIFAERLGFRTTEQWIDPLEEFESERRVEIEMPAYVVGGVVPREGSAAEALANMMMNFSVKDREKAGIVSPRPPESEENAILAELGSKLGVRVAQWTCLTEGDPTRYPYYLPIRFSGPSANPVVFEGTLTFKRPSDLLPSDLLAVPAIASGDPPTELITLEVTIAGIESLADLPDPEWWRIEHTTNARLCFLPVGCVPADRPQADGESTYRFHVPPGRYRVRRGFGDNAFEVLAPQEFEVEAGVVNRVTVSLHPERAWFYLALDVRDEVGYPLQEWQVQFSPVKGSYYARRQSTPAEPLTTLALQRWRPGYDLAFFAPGYEKIEGLHVNSPGPRETQELPVRLRRARPSSNHPGK